LAYLIKDITQLITCRNKSYNPKCGKEQSDIGLIKNGNIFINGGNIEYVGKSDALKKFLKKNGKKNFKVIDGKNKTVMPGFIDSHTHLIFSGSRANEYEMRISGSTYEEIAKAGGGISVTVNSVRKTSRKVLFDISEARLINFVKNGTTTIEGKSGYGLDTRNEIKMLEVLNDLNNKNKFGLDILSTFLGAHSIPPEMSKRNYIELVCYDMVPRIAKKRLARFIDVFCEKGYYSAKESQQVLSIGSKFGLIPKMHTDQFNSIGGIDTAVNVNAVSVDHLEEIEFTDIKKLEGKRIIATLLPGVSYYLDITYQPARKLVENNVPVALATDFNPGSCMTENIQGIMSLASLKLKMSAEEIINAVTINAAFALFLQDKIGSIETGKQADLLIFDFDSYKDLLYHFGINQLQTVFKKGKRIYSS
jgi:imidazolonepropionase